MPSVLRAARFRHALAGRIRPGAVAAGHDALIVHADMIGWFHTSNAHRRYICDWMREGVLIFPSDSDSGLVLLSFFTQSMVLPPGGQPVPGGGWQFAEPRQRPGFRSANPRRYAESQRFKTGTGTAVQLHTGSADMPNAGSGGDGRTTGHPAAIVEFGPSALFARTHPGITLWIHSGRSTVRAPDLTGAPFGLAGLAGLVRLLRRDALGFIACHVPATSAWTTAIERAGHAAVARLSRRPVVGLDFGDDMRLSRPALRVLDASRLFFKRELPPDPLDLLPDGAGSAERRLLERNIGKVRPVSIGLAPWRILDMPEPLPPKSADVFFAGALNSDVRRRGAALLPRLRDAGISVDFAEGGLDRTSYLRRMAAARLAWSPEGLGWQCFRHFEAAAAGTVPVINRPRITMPHPLRDGEHCFHYAPGSDDLLAVIRRALADPARLERMAGAARRHVLAHHTHEAIAGGILDALAGILPPADHAAVRRLEGVPASAGAGR